VIDSCWDHQKISRFDEYSDPFVSWVLCVAAILVMTSVKFPGCCNPTSNVEEACSIQDIADFFVFMKVSKV
jgi:hypothetical protein